MSSTSFPEPEALTNLCETSSPTSAPAVDHRFRWHTRDGHDVSLATRCTRVGNILWMLVADLHHFLDLPEDLPGPARRLAGRLTGIVRAASAGDAGASWTSALPCPRRPGHRACPGRTVVHRPEPSAPIEWRCSACDDQGVISNWENTPYDLRRRRLGIAGAVRQIMVSHETAAALRDLRLLDPDCERLVFRIRAHDDAAALLTTDEELEALIGFVAAEANHEPDRRRRRRLDAALDTLEAAARIHHGHPTE